VFALDREWYLPFQKFRYQLVKLVDELLNILDNYEDYYFTFDGQTIVLEDYFEIRPEKKEKLLSYIREGRITVGPWYILPDIWLVGQESLIRNLEYSYDLATKDFDVPLMKIGYLPDMFGHSRAIPQLFGNLTDFKVLMVWRGVPPQIKVIPFHWKSSNLAKTSLLTIYMPFGYGNAAHLPEEPRKLTAEIKNLVSQLKPYSPISVYLLHHGTDHQVPNQQVALALEQVQIKNMRVKLGVLNDFVVKYKEILDQADYQVPEYAGELRSAYKAHLLQDTYSARMWIKIWNQKVEDLLVHYAEPLNTYLWHYFDREYPTSYLNQAWKWHLRNQPHDSICGCSVDQTHEEMKFRYSFAESIVENTIDDAVNHIEEETEPSSNLSYLVFNPTNCSEELMYFEFNAPEKTTCRTLTSPEGDKYEVQPLRTSSDMIWEMKVGTKKLKVLMKMFPGRQLMGLYINDAYITDGDDPDTCEVRLLMGDKPEGEFDAGNMKKMLLEVIDGKKYKNLNILMTKELEQTYGVLAPLSPMGFSVFKIDSDSDFSNSAEKLVVSKNGVSNGFYNVTFNKDGTINLLDKKTSVNYSNLHKFEDWGDRGDEYTFGRLEPEFVKATKIKRSIEIIGPLFCDILQHMQLELFEKVDSAREKRIGKVEIPVTVRFRFYRDIPRIDMRTELTNQAKDHRLRICFDLPFSSKYTKTSTHFGYIERFGAPVGDDSYIEKPSGIQPQKGYIRIDDDTGNASATVFNKGLPEVELVNNSLVALTLIRSIGWLSRSGIPERPEHAGPYYATPGAQELGQSYTFEYSFISNSLTETMASITDQSEAFSLIPKSISLKNVQVKDKILQPIMRVSNPNIRISSLRVRNENVCVTLYNLLNEEINVDIQLTSKIKNLVTIKYDGSEVEQIEVSGNKCTLHFSPHEIMLCKLT
jgi:alpha-mannosidase